MSEGRGGKKRKIAREDADHKHSATVLVFNARMVYTIGYLEPNSLHGSVPRVSRKHSETVGVKGAKQRQGTRSIEYHLDFVRGSDDTLFRIMSARSSAPLTPNVWWGADPPQYLSELCVSKLSGEEGFAFTELTTWADIAREAAHMREAATGCRMAFFIWHQVLPIIFMLAPCSYSIFS